jgi:hypothetical protein
MEAEPDSESKILKLSKVAQRSILVCLLPDATKTEIINNKRIRLVLILYFVSK